MRTSVAPSRNTWPSTACRTRSAKCSARLLFRAGKDGDELLAAVAPRHVDLPGRLLDDLGRLVQDHVARGVAVRVVDGLEAVQVHHGHGDGLARARAALELVVQQLVHVAVVEQLRQAVGDGQLLEPLVGQLQLAVLLVQLVLQELDAQHGPHPRLELAEVVGLADVVVGAALQPLHHVLGLVEGRDQDDGDEGQRLVVLDAPGHLVPVQPGHHHVQQDQVRRLFLDAVQRLLARWPP